MITNDNYLYVRTYRPSNIYRFVLDDLQAEPIKVEQKKQYDLANWERIPEDRRIKKAI